MSLVKRGSVNFCILPQLFLFNQLFQESPFLLVLMIKLKPFLLTGFEPPFILNDQQFEGFFFACALNDIRPDAIFHFPCTLPELDGTQALL